MKKFKSDSLVVSAFWYTIGSFILKGINFFTVPIFANLLTLDDYGVTTIIGTWISIITIIGGLGINGTLGTAKSNLDDNEYKEYTTSVLFLSLISFLVLFLLSILFNNFFEKIIGLSSDIIFLIIIQSFFGYVINFVSSIYIFDKSNFKYLFLSCITTILNVAISVYFVVSMTSDRYMGKLYGGTISSIVVGIVLLAIYLKKGSKFISIKYWKFCLPIAIPLIFHSLSHLVLNQADRIMLQKMTNDAVVGLYGFTYNIGSIIHIIMTALNSAWIAWYFEAVKNSKKDEIKNKVKNYMVLFTIFTMLFILGSPELIKILAPEKYWQGISLIPLITVGYYFVFLYTFGVNYEFHKKKTVLIATGTVLAGIVNIVLNYIFIPYLGAEGSALATLISYIMLFVFHEIIVRIVLKYEEFPFKYYNWSIFAIAICCVIFYIFINSLLIRAIVALVVIISVAMLVKKNKIKLGL